MAVISTALNAGVGAPSSGFVVSNVFKLEHKVNLHKFQKLTAGRDPSTVKGLFTSLPAGSVARVVALGIPFRDSASVVP